jgi:hypothetical protein
MPATRPQLGLAHRYDQDHKRITATGMEADGAPMENVILERISQAFIQGHLFEEQVVPRRDYKCVI